MTMEGPVNVAMVPAAPQVDFYNILCVTRVVSLRVLWDKCLKVVNVPWLKDCTYS